MLSDPSVIASAEISAIGAVLGLRVMPNVVNSLGRAIDKRKCAADQPVKLVKLKPKEGRRP
jgi:hypothetical protein